MLNIGIIGDIKSLESYIGYIQKSKDMQIVGKSSIGIPNKDDQLKFTIPEFNRVELIDRADALIINNFSLFPFSFLCDMVKKSKHIFATEYPGLSLEECSQLVKLTQEAKTVFQFLNPLSQIPPFNWLAENIKLPTLLNISFLNERINEKDDLIQLLLVLNRITGIKPKKMHVSSFKGSSENSFFTNLHFLFGDASVVNLSYGQTEIKNEFTIYTYAEKQFATFNIPAESYLVNNQKIKLKGMSEMDEFNGFIDTLNGKKKNITQMDDYYTVLESVERINKKLNQFS